MLVQLSRAAVKRARALIRSESAVHPQWPQRAEICQRCPLCVVQCGKSYCGQPLMRKLDRDEPTEGCGCPINLKAKDPREHCPRNRRWDASTKSAGQCDCVWCVAAREPATVLI